MLSAISTKILLGLAAISTVVLGFFSQSTNLGSTVPITPAIFETSLASPIGASDTSMTLSSATLLDGTTLSGYVCFTLDSGQPNLEYVCGTASSTSITSMTRGINPLNGTSSVTALKYTHRRGANVKITDYPALSIVGRIVNGIDTFPTTVKYDSSVSNANIQADNRNLVNYGLLAATVIAGGIPASDSTAGIVKLSTAAASTTNPIVVGDNDVRIPTSAQSAALAGTSGTGASSTNKFVDNNDTNYSISSSTVVRRNAAGRAEITSPTTGNEIANKTYVDGVKMNVIRFVGTTTPSGTSETTLFSTTTPGGTIDVNGFIRIRSLMEATPDNNGSAGEVFTLRLKYGGSTIASSTISCTKGNWTGRFAGWMEGWILNNSSTTSQNTGVYPALGFISSAFNSAGSVGIVTSQVDTTSSVNSAANQTLSMTIQRTDGTNCSSSFRQFVIEYIK